MIKKIYHTIRNNKKKTIESNSPTPPPPGEKHTGSLPV